MLRKRNTPIDHYVETVLRVGDEKKRREGLQAAKESLDSPTPQQVRFQRRPENCIDFSSSLTWFGIVCRYKGYAWYPELFRVAHEYAARAVTLLPVSGWNANWSHLIDLLVVLTLTGSRTEVRDFIALQRKHQPRSSDPNDDDSGERPELDEGDSYTLLLESMLMGERADLVSLAQASAWVEREHRASFEPVLALMPIVLDGPTAEVSKQMSTAVERSKHELLLNQREFCDRLPLAPEAYLACVARRWAGIKDEPRLQSGMVGRMLRFPPLCDWNEVQFFWE